MPQPFSQGPMKKRTAVLVFLKGTTAPIVLYVENPISVYEELTQILKLNSPTPKLIEKTTMGPIRKVCIQSTVYVIYFISTKIFTVFFINFPAQIRINTAPRMPVKASKCMQLKYLPKTRAIIVKSETNTSANM